ncbi:hypothetical protein DINM_000442 [Dirofilaria immitis]|nr:hypothetical protein [Dirofilaria immitis]
MIDCTLSLIATFVTYPGLSSFEIKNITQTSNEDSPGYVTKVAISESVQSIILEKLGHFWDNITQASYITQNSNQDDARNVRDIATNGSEGREYMKHSKS